ncbi:MAG: formylglycine-generating enzyme family protein [Pseudomonadota bacterium]
MLLCAVFLPDEGTAQQSLTLKLADGRTVAPLENLRECDVCPEMIVMPLGSFMMGATLESSRNPFDFYGKSPSFRVRGPDEINIVPDEHPRHRVEIDIPFAMARNELTHREWMVCVADGGCSHNPDHRVLVFREGYVRMGPDHPVMNVSYLDALEYVAWLNGRVGADVYRLPTEAEWEYAARAGTETRFAQGDDLTADQANFSRSATERILMKDMPHLTNRERPVRVHELDAANFWGLRHMSGNLLELTLSCWSDEHIGLSSTGAYLNLARSQQDCHRSVKGGAFASAMDGLRLAWRSRAPENFKRDFLGFRILRELAKD